MLHYFEYWAKNGFVFNLTIDFIKQYRQKYLFNDNTFLMNKHKIYLNSGFKRLFRLFYRFYQYIEIYFWK